MENQTRSVNLFLVSALVVTVALSGFAFGMLAYGQNVLPVASGQTVDQERILTVSGVGTIKAAPNELIINVGVLTEASTAQVAVQDNAAKMSAVVDAIKGVGVESSGIETSYYNVYPIYKYDKETGVGTIIGYGVQNTVNIKTNLLDKAGTIIDVAVSAGANTVNGVSFGLSDLSQKQLQSQALTLACQNAREKADIVAASLGVKIVGVKTVNVGGSVPVPMPIYRADVTAGASTPIIPPSEQQLTANVDVVFLIA